MYNIHTWVSAGSYSEWFIADNNATENRKEIKMEKTTQPTSLWKHCSQWSPAPAPILRVFVVSSQFTERRGEWGGGGAGQQHLSWGGVFSQHTFLPSRLWRRWKLECGAPGGEGPRPFGNGGGLRVEPDFLYSCHWSVKSNASKPQGEQKRKPGLSAISRAKRRKSTWVQMLPRKRGTGKHLLSYGAPGVGQTSLELRWVPGPTRQMPSPESPHRWQQCREGAQSVSTERRATQIRPAPGKNVYPDTRRAHTRKPNCSGGQTSECFRRTHRIPYYLGVADMFKQDTGSTNHTGRMINYLSLKWTEDVLRRCTVKTQWGRRYVCVCVRKTCAHKSLWPSL